MELRPSLLSLFVFYIFSYLLSKSWVAFLGAWCPLPAFRSCFVAFTRRLNALLMNLWGRKCSPRPTPPPSWLLPPTNYFYICFSFIKWQSIIFFLKIMKALVDIMFLQKKFCQRQNWVKGRLLSLWGLVLSCPCLRLGYSSRRAWLFIRTILFGALWTPIFPPALVLVS